ncbi:hypothetical protein TRFO_27952 [Tritrichomonas foetus]|uniref:Right handed beta helix domain-containing protein n=1 Tax=Tritrichomonas foetus TaxID=1144522 RepID=A0A1J4JZH3_9EUKA|nr:hypothetical protein TRFO_27952 [Tritrichomonas foetus]|eukprot:OHT04561.1 hypothetical protein TRFO_27952 [Tritrichomonas foetus]
MNSEIKGTFSGSQYPVTPQNTINGLRLESTGEDEEFTFSHLSFTECLGQNQRCFDLHARKPFIFSHIIVQNSPIGNYLGAIQFDGYANDNDRFVFDNCKWLNNNCNSQMGGGAGLWLTNSQKLMEFEFYNCEFNGNKQEGKGGAFHDGNSTSVDYKILTFTTCKFLNNTAKQYGGALAIETTGDLIIDGCTFNGNSAKLGGGALFINPVLVNKATGAIIRQMNEAILRNNKFNNNNVESSIGTSIYLYKGLLTTIVIEGTNTIPNTGEQGSLIYSECGDLIINYITFEYKGTAEKSFRALELADQSGTTIVNCSFIATGFASSAEGHSLLIHRATLVSIQGCTFSNCGKNNNNYVIVSNSKEFHFENSILTFNESGDTCAGIKINYRSKVYITGSTFSNIKSPSATGGALNYGSLSGSTSQHIIECDLRVQGTLFQNIVATNGRAVFAQCANYNTWSNCTIKDMPDGGYILALFHQAKRQDTARMENMIFISNKAKCNDGGEGSGLWVSHVNKLILQHCKFIDNIATHPSANGGALGYSKSDSLKPTELEFVNCIFRDNQVQSGCNGSALYIESSQKPVTIRDCQFSTTTSSASNGGAIYIHSSSKDITIEGTTFKGMQIKGNGTGNAIYIENMTNSVKIEDCSFTDCGINDGSVIYTVGKSLEFIGSTITFTTASYDASCRGIQIFSKSSVVIKNTLFEKCWVNGEDEWGAGFCYSKKELFDYKFDEYIELDHVIFDNCECPNGRAIYAACWTASQLSFVTVQNINHRTENIFTWGYRNNPISYCKLDQCSFINLSSSAIDGGGCGLWMGDAAVSDFYACTFQNIVSGTNGGAFSFYPHSRLTKQSFVFYKCLFDNNKAADNCKGGALYIQITGTVNITSCNFTSNSVKGSGAAIYITNTCPNVYIDNTEFHHNSENEKGRGNAISFATGLKLVTIFLCKFVDCGATGWAIESNSTDLTIQNTTIRFTHPNIGSRGIRIFETSTLKLLHSQLIGCNSIEKGTEAGGGIYYDGLKNTQQIESINIIGTIFDANTADNGCAMMLFINEVPVIQDNIIRNHQNGKYIVSIFYRKLLEEVSIDDCMFENNLFTESSTSSPDGGGCAIWIAPMRGITDSSYQIIFNN